MLEEEGSIMQHTRSATELAPVLVEPNGSGGADVWLRANIMEMAEEDGSQVFWHADEVHGVVPGIPSEDEVEADFDGWWERLEEASLTAEDKLGKLEAQVLFTALMTDTEV